MEKVLITGITGKSGTYLIDEFIRQYPENMQISAIVRPSSNVQKIKENKLDISLLSGDLEDEPFLNDALRGIDTVLHIAGIQKSLKLVKAAVQNDVHRLILVHTTGIYSKYKAAGAEYIEIETKISDMIKNRPIALTILRPTMIYGSLNDSNMIQFIKMVDRFPIFPVVNHGTFPLQPVHQKDLGKAYYEVLLHPEKTQNKNYDLSGGTVIDLIDILKSIRGYLGKNTHFVSVPFWFAYTGAAIVYGLTLGKMDFREKVQRLVEPRAYSHEKATADFGYAPIHFQDGLKDEVFEYKRRPTTK